MNTKQARKLNERVFNDNQKRIGYIRSKYSDIASAPLSIKNEYANLEIVNNSLKKAMMGENVWGLIESSDKCIIDSFEQIDYVKACLEIEKNKKINSEYVTKSDEQNYVSPVFNKDSVIKRIQEAKDSNEISKITSELNNMIIEGYYTFQEILEIDRILSFEVKNKSEEIDKVRKDELHEDTTHPIPKGTLKWFQFVKKIRRWMNDKKIAKQAGKEGISKNEINNGNEGKREDFLKKLSVQTVEENTINPVEPKTTKPNERIKE